MSWHHPFDRPLHSANMKKPLSELSIAGGSIRVQRRSVNLWRTIWPTALSNSGQRYNQITNAEYAEINAAATIRSGVAQIGPDSAHADMSQSGAGNQYWFANCVAIGLRGDETRRYIYQATAYGTLGATSNRFLELWVGYIWEGNHSSAKDSSGQTAMLQLTHQLPLKMNRDTYYLGDGTNNRSLSFIDTQVYFRDVSGPPTNQPDYYPFSAKQNSSGNTERDRPTKLALVYLCKTIPLAIDSGSGPPADGGWNFTGHLGIERLAGVDHGIVAVTA